MLADREREQTEAARSVLPRHAVKTNVTVFLYVFLFFLLLKIRKQLL